MYGPQVCLRTVGVNGGLVQATFLARHSSGVFPDQIGASPNTEAIFVYACTAASAVPLVRPMRQYGQAIS
jgi:hypothetical protein